MNNLLVVVALFLSLVTVKGTEQWVIAYWAGWENTIQTPDDIDYSLFTHIVVGSALVKDSSTGSLDTSFFQGSVAQGETIAMKITSNAHKSSRKALLMFGGGGYGWPILSAMQTNPSALVTTLVSTAKRLGFDGIDLDWEDNIDATLFVDLVKRLKSADSSLTLTVPGMMMNPNMSPTVASYIPELVKQGVERYSVMSYIPSCVLWGYGWLSWHASPISGCKTFTPVCIEDTLTRLTNAGIPKSKLGLGIGLYAGCYTGGITGPNQATTGTGSIIGSDGSMPLRTLQWDPATRHWDNEALTSYLSLSTANAQGCQYVTFDDEESMEFKGNWSRANGYGGVIVRSIGKGYIGSNPIGKREPFMSAIARGFLSSSGGGNAGGSTSNSAADATNGVGGNTFGGLKAGGVIALIFFFVYLPACAVIMFVGWVVCRKAVMSTPFSIIPSKTELHAAYSLFKSPPPPPPPAAAIPASK